MKYEAPAPISRDEAEKVFTHGSPPEIGEALYRVTHHERDWEWVEKWCIKFCKNPDPSVRVVAVNCLGELAHIHRDKKLKRVIPVLKELLNDTPEVAYEARGALEDLEIFLTPKSN
jgi:HEAT repeat